MGKCVRIHGCSKPPAAAAASCLTLRSGRRVPPVAASSVCSPRTSGRPRRHRGSALRRWCGAEAADRQRACGSPRRRGTADTGSPKELCDNGQPEEEVPSSQAADTGAAVARGVDGRGDSFDGRRPKTPLVTDDCDAAAAKVQAKHGNESRYSGGGVAGQLPSPPPPPPTEAEIEAFFTAAEVAERRRFAEAYNYDVALDRPLEGRFEWAPMST